MTPVECMARAWHAERRKYNVHVPEEYELDDIASAGAVCAVIADPDCAYLAGPMSWEECNRWIDNRVARAALAAIREPLLAKAAEMGLAMRDESPFEDAVDILLDAALKEEPTT